MILHHPRSRPNPWAIRKQAVKPRWLVPFVGVEWLLEWLAYGLSNWRLIEVLEYLETFSVLVAIIFYFAESGDRVKQRHYQAWQVINTAQGKGGSGGRIEALQELNADHVPLVGVDVSSAFLQGLDLKNANLLRADFDAADLRDSNLSGVDFTLASLHSANLRGAALDRAKFLQTDLSDADLTGCNLQGADLSGANLDNTDLRSADLKGARGQRIKSIKGANITGVRNPPDGFVEWALKNGAIQSSTATE